MRLNIRYQMEKGEVKDLEQEKQEKNISEQKKVEVIRNNYVQFVEEIVKQLN